ncbi:hypothetical protein [Thalassococcus sp. S3]|uniref:hypothetical protein n=1 Tax=Thalassococcus sp. S3 TaxID=2017482 RepID=UPI00102B46EB|nr:hypothetical protein [Thalassococcus sp. S3]
MKFENLRRYATGHTGGMKGHSACDLMVYEIGQELFATLYRARWEAKWGSIDDFQPVTPPEDTGTRVCAAEVSSGTSPGASGMSAPGAFETDQEQPDHAPQEAEPELCKDDILTFIDPTHGTPRSRLDRLRDHARRIVPHLSPWTGDVVGAACLFIALFVGLYIGAALQ